MIFIPVSEISWIELVVKSLFLLSAVTIWQVITRNKWKLQTLKIGFIFIIIWCLMEVIDEFLTMNVFRELAFNIFGRIILIIGLILLIKEFNRLSGLIHAKK